MTTPGTDWDRLGRYMAGELSPAEAGEVQRWLSENANDATVLAALDAATRNMPSTKPVNVEAALRRVKARLAPRAPWQRYAGWAAVAAAAVVVIAVGVNALRGPAQPSSSATVVGYSTAVGTRDSITLADGSRVILGPASRIEVRDRDVVLTTGEAFFVVVHDEERPFTVRAGGAMIRDIGTEFSVHSDREGDVRVVVREGAVQLAGGADSVLLAPGDVGTLSAGRVSASRGSATADDLAWTSGRLVFRNASVAELTADLRRWYGVELRVTDSALRQRHFTGSFANEPSSRVLDVIALALGARVDRRGDTVHIRPAATSR
jgi:transmembrane sensor